MEFRLLHGVLKASAGYVSGSTLEAVRVEFDCEQVSYVELLDVFFAMQPADADSSVGESLAVGQPDDGKATRWAIWCYDAVQQQTAQHEASSRALGRFVDIQHAGVWSNAAIGPGGYV